MTSSCSKGNSKIAVSVFGMGAFLFACALPVLPARAETQAPMTVGVAHVLAFESDQTLEREAFGWQKLEQKTVLLKDDQDDLVVFDRLERRVAPAVRADIKEMEIAPADTHWNFIFRTWDKLPDDPAMPVNFDVFFDRDSEPGNNAPDGVFRAKTDLAFMLLFGTRTKWHATSWMYSPEARKWNERSELPLYKVEADSFRLEVPYTLVAKDAKAQVRGFSLTSEVAITAVDVIPGRGIPKAISKP